VNHNIEVSCVAKAKEMWYFDAVFWPCFFFLFLGNIPCFSLFYRDFSWSIIMFQPRCYVNVGEGQYHQI
jgi:hypothetical protein